MTLRERHLERLRTEHFDTLVVGGGINGAVTAASLAGRGAAVAIIDRGDFAHDTSQASSNLVWGGFKYLENYELYLVWKLCRSRNRLLRAYPANIRQIGFYASLDESAPYRPWFAGLGAFGYWIIGQFGTRPPRLLSRAKIEHEEPVIDTTTVAGGIEYFDGLLVDNDARFVFSFVRAAIEAGAAAANYVELVSAERVEGRWVARVRNVDAAGRGDVASDFTVTATTIVNAAGPHVGVLNDAWGVRSEHRIVFSKGIHLVVPRLTTEHHHRVLAFFDDTQRLFYVIPMGRRSVIGTTDTRVDEPTTAVTDDDVEFLLGQINERLDLATPLTPADVIAHRCGVRPLVVSTTPERRWWKRWSRTGEPNASFDEVDWTKLSRKHAVETDRSRRIVTIFGGKLTDCLNVGEEVAAAVESLGVPLEPDLRNWYGEPSEVTRTEFYRQARLMHLDEYRTKADTEPLTDRLWRRYGRRAFGMLEAIRADPTMAEDVMGSADYLRVELDSAAHSEMVTKLEDFMHRRSKIELVVPDDEIAASSGLYEVATILFGDDAERRLAEYFGGADAIPPAIASAIDAAKSAKTVRA